MPISLQIYRSRESNFSSSSGVNSSVAVLTKSVRKWFMVERNECGSSIIVMLLSPLIRVISYTSLLVKESK